MRDTYTRLFIHAVWSTWNRAPLIAPAIEQALYACIRAECENMKAELLEIGGDVDHVHILVQLPPTVSVSDLIKQVKGSSSHMSTHALVGLGNFKWQGSYSAFTISEQDVPRVQEYIRRQKEHHRNRTIDTRFEVMH